MQPKRYILLVDDDATAHFLTRRALSGHEIDGEILEAYDGVDACEKIKFHGRPLLVLLDLSMPRMDGYEFLELLSSGELGEPPLVYVVSSSCRPQDQRLDKEFSFVQSCLEKPISKALVLQFSLLLETSAEPGKSLQ